MEPINELSPCDRAGVLDLASAAGSADGAAPLNEEATLSLARNDALHWLVREGNRLRGYAQWQPGNDTGQLVVHPHHRRARLGTALLDGLRRTATPSVWAFGTLPSARAFAEASGLAPVRGLTMMQRTLANEPCATPPDGITLRGFTEADTGSFLALNAVAFAHHREQGHFTSADFQSRRSEDWWDPAGLILAIKDGRPCGFHWTKRHDAATGEVYVLGVSPETGGRGLGRALLQAGLSRLFHDGATRAILYVDADNKPALGLYRKTGFTDIRTDTLYGPGSDVLSR